MFNLGFSELLILGAIALIFIGPKELPEVARVIGRMLNELRRAGGDLKSSLLEAKPDLSQLNDYHVPEHKMPAVDNPPGEESGKTQESPHDDKKS